MEIIVTNCRNCPFIEHNFNIKDHKSETPYYANCIAPIEIHMKYNVNSYFKNYKPPNWCPIKKQSVIITHK